MERLLRGTALAQDYQLPIAPHLAALSELLCKNQFYYILFYHMYVVVGIGIIN